MIKKVTYIIFFLSYFVMGAEPNKITGNHKFENISVSDLVNGEDTSTFEKGTYTISINLFKSTEGTLNIEFISYDNDQISVKTTSNFNILNWELNNGLIEFRAMDLRTKKILLGNIDISNNKISMTEFDKNRYIFYDSK